MFAMSLPSADLSSYGKNVARIIFGKGEDVGYGLMFRSVFSFTDLIKLQNKAILLDAYKRLSVEMTPESVSAGTLRGENVYQIGIHIRHSSNRDTGNGTTSESVETQCIRSVLSEQDMSGKKCILMVY